MQRLSFPDVLIFPAVEGDFTGVSALQITFLSSSLRALNKSEKLMLPLLGNINYIYSYSYSLRSWNNTHRLCNLPRQVYVMNIYIYIYIYIYIRMYVYIYINI